jgi:hypothetical protein
MRIITDKYAAGLETTRANIGRMNLAEREEHRRDTKRKIQTEVAVLS